uniref:Uncharacterized protein n=1 Tax=Coccidioides posadasii RMSCC 3488 TaxID=454284 RepID=A0A0J6F8N8_COCPO|nr:hypothetical protein CPAG_05707 [Coccidioides posadasii RMSCC 3488]
MNLGWRYDNGDDNDEELLGVKRVPASDRKFLKCHSPPRDRATSGKDALILFQTMASIFSRMQTRNGPWLSDLEPLGCNSCTYSSAVLAKS